ncbi:hypothetical protein BH11PSE4_BH11PSE4_35230 [soil metagenome]
MHVNAAHAAIYDDTKDISGWLLPDETEKLYEMAHFHGDVILEVGTFRGRSAAVINEGARNQGSRPDRQFFSVDIDPASGFHAYDILAPRRLADRAIFFHGNLATFRDAFPVTPTMAFIDGDHTYEGVKADLEQLTTLLAPNTPVAFHDYLNTDTPGVARALDDWIAQGFATKTGEYGCSGFVITTAKCTGGQLRLSEAAFQAAHREFLARIGAVKQVQTRLSQTPPSPPSTREKIAELAPWLVPIVRGIKRAVGMGAK